MKKELATYILKLNEAAKSTKQAEDRPLYQKYIAHAAIILAMVENGAEAEVINNEVQDHERLWGNTWLIDDAYKSPSSAWQKIKEVV